jgi:glutathionylspermidine synthase
MASRQERLVENQDRFRRANERFEERVSRLIEDEQQVPFVCECADEACTQAVNVTLSEYGDVRGVDSRYLLFPGHPTIPDEDVVERHERYVVAEKTRA